MRKKVQLISALIVLVALLVRCSKANPDVIANGALPLTVQSPGDNPQTPAKVALGRVLFWDPILSANRDVACASCHHPSLGYGDALDLSIGVNGSGLGASRHFNASGQHLIAKRNAQSILNTGFNGSLTDGTYDPQSAPMFFDNRARSLELQSLEPIKALEEMRGQNIPNGSILDTVVARLQRIPQYVTLFNQAFDGGSPSVSNLGKAIAAVERTIVANHSPFDEYKRGNTSAMTATQVRGMNAFTTNGCANCHSGPMFSDYSVHVLSVPDNAKVATDAGNGAYAFRTPSLRNLSFTAPYMHNGTLTSLDAVLNLYDQIGDRRSQNPHVPSNALDGNLRRLNNGDRAAIIEFLNALNDPNFDKTVPQNVPSGLRPGGNL